MPKNIVLLSDGTGNSAATLFKTNVRRLYEALDLSNPDLQIAFYDNGIGTSTFKPFAILGGIFGFGLKRNVLAIYSYLCRHYQNGDRIFGFGFSRGSFTMRIVAGLVVTQGLVKYDGNERNLARKGGAAYRRYRKRFNATGGMVGFLRWLRDVFVPKFDPDDQRPPDPDQIHFLGLWDTVAAYGGSIQEITRGIDYWLWPLSMPDRVMSSKIRRACHALALDDERDAFWPVLWDETRVQDPDGRQHKMTKDWSPPEDGKNLPDIDRERLSQVWFTGMHSDVGGGYPQDGLSYVTLDWMIDRARVYRLEILDDARRRIKESANPYDKLNDSRHGIAVYYRYKPRKLEDVHALDSKKPALMRDLNMGVLRALDSVKPTLSKNLSAKVQKLQDSGKLKLLKKPATQLQEVLETHLRPVRQPDPTIHESVFRRIKKATDGYSPIVLPGSYRVTTSDGDLKAGVYEDLDQSRRRAYLQERVWNLVWWRRVLYFLTLAASIFVAGIPLWNHSSPEQGLAGRAAVLIPAIDAVNLLLPSFVGPWVAACKARPDLLLIGAVLIGLCLYISGKLREKTGDMMRSLWSHVREESPGTVMSFRPIRGALFPLRTSGIYRRAWYALTTWILPTICAALIVVGVLAGLNRISFALANDFGRFCESGAVHTVFDARELCHTSGAWVDAGKDYKIILSGLDLPWHDAGITTDPNGFGSEKLTWKMYPGLLIRRHLTQNWFQMMARIGRYGADEQPLHFTSVAAPAGEESLTAKFHARSSGEVFVYVNDAVIAIPGLTRAFYANNKGHASVRVFLEPDQRKD
jgi:uncharacterized protein (DUF2235 family)